MKKLLIPILALLLCACTSEDSEQATKQITFHIDNITEEYSTRATIAGVGMTDLWVWEGSTLIDYQVSTDEDFGSPTVDLTYGSHNLTFVASKAEGQSLASGVWSTTKVRDTFAKCMNITVSANSGNSRQVELARRSSQVCFNIQDVIPTGVKSVHMTASNHTSLNASLVGGSAGVFDITLDISSYVGKSYQPVMNLLTESATDEEDCDVMIEFLDASNNILYHFERTIKLKPNRCTTLKGKYFTGSSNDITVDDTWQAELIVPLWQ